MDNYYISYLFVDDFIRIHKLLVYDSNIVHALPLYSAIIRLYLDNLYFYIHQYYGRYILTIKTFAKGYKLYGIDWFGNDENFMNVVNGLNLSDIKIMDDSYYIHHIDQSKFLDVILNSIVKRREYIIWKYGLK